MTSSWQERLETMPSPSSLVTWLNIWVLLLLLLFLASNYVFLPGFDEMPNLPVAEHVKVMRANKLVITVTPEWFIYDTCRGRSFREIESVVDKALLDALHDDNQDREVSLVVRADRDVSFERLVQIFSYAQGKKDREVHVFLATESPRENPLLNVEMD